MECGVERRGGRTSDGTVCEHLHCILLDGGSIIAFFLFFFLSYSSSFGSRVGCVELGRLEFWGGRRVDWAGYWQLELELGLGLELQLEL